MKHVWVTNNVNPEGAQKPKKKKRKDKDKRSSHCHPRITERRYFILPSFSSIKANKRVRDRSLEQAKNKQFR